MQDNHKSVNIRKKLPFLIGTFTALIWGITYFISAQLHGMQVMFDPMFPFLIACILGIHINTMSVLKGTLFAMLDAGTVGWLLGWLIRWIFRNLVI